MIITLQLQGNNVHIALSRAENLECCDRVKVHTPASYLVLNERNKRESGKVSLAQGEMMHIDAYGVKGEGHLLSQDYQLEETGLVLVSTDWNEGIQIVIAQKQAS